MLNIMFQTRRISQCSAPSRASTTPTEALNMLNIIGISGPAQSGKSTLAGEFRRLIEFRGLAFHEKPFAGPLKAMLAAAGVDISEQGKNIPDARFGATPRVLMQTLGTEWGRSLNPDCWLNVWRSQLPHDGWVLVPDVRFDNEAEIIRELGGIIIHIQRKPTAEMLAVPAHASETGITKHKSDIIFRNDRGIEKMAAIAANILDNAK